MCVGSKISIQTKELANLFFTVNLGQVENEVIKPTFVFIGYKSTLITFNCSTCPKILHGLKCRGFDHSSNQVRLVFGSSQSSVTD